MIYGQLQIITSLVYSSDFNQMVKLQQFKLYCLPLYATEVMPLSERLVQSLDRCVRQAVAKIFATLDNNCIKEIRSLCDLPDIGVLIECRRVKFVDKMLTNGQYVFLVVWGSADDFL